MSINRILKKRRQHAQNNQQNSYNEQKSNEITNHLSETPRSSQQDQIPEQQLQRYAQFLQSNPSSYELSNSYFPFNASVYNKYKMPISIFLPPVSYEMDPIQRSIDKIPRCGSCRAYMNYYNEVKKKSYLCFLCRRENNFATDYVIDTQNIQLSQPSYHLLGGQNVYNQAPPEVALIFLLDLNMSSFQSKMLQYFILVAKEILSRQQLNETQIYFFTYDEVIHEYDFSGEQVKCTIFDPSIKQNVKRVQQNFLGNIRERLFILLDSLEEISKNNKKNGSNFFQAFTYVHQAIRHTGGKLFVFQSNQAISGEQIFNQHVKKEGVDNEGKPKSFLETKNKTFFNSFVHNLLTESISCSFFIFQKNYKNIRIFADLSKLTNSEVNVYRRDSPEDLLKFYYQFYYLLGTNYYRDVRMELVVSTGWYFTAVYGNLFRIKQHITFKYCHLDPSKRACVCILPNQQANMPYCSIQVITNYRYNRQHFVTVNTLVIPVTNRLEKLYSNQNYTLITANIHKSILSALRLEEINMLKNKVTKQIGQIWKAAKDFYKNRTIPSEIQGLVLSSLGLLKSTHFQLQSINDSIILDNVVAQRTYLQCCNYTELHNFFSPYLFDLSNMTQQMCRDDENFVYPDVVELKFASVKQGMFLMDNGLSLFLFIAKSCNPIFLKQLFGKDKFVKGEYLSETNFLDNNLFVQQVTNLIRICRQQKGYGWIPLYIVRCGEQSLNQKIFYMNFYGDKYNEFRQFNITLNEFIAMINQQY